MIIIFMYSKYHDSVIEVDCQGHQISYNYFKWVSSKYKKFENGKKKNLLTFMSIETVFYYTKLDWRTLPPY